ncbi:uncharacterized protein BO95DRAFT_518857 [Aspergillus brunneoviolaceus CBS 621.78]|uniref:Uncharacterized protein n=1 Tax=Aspergillus brunneoviolaceus CBS 621.78 TaxID=1450534 RepID=A0ACD1FTM3_9EURO|nr:hypothetical protein BO95DRAFT_518857 [Aspergillus brunneoviolaceus CBS 621.78]RAH40304.1 hypothetical protein BO95DRAFT_518857 [Aspergillus brunneoviolaceus CBS 621.78]
MQFFQLLVILAAGAWPVSAASCHPFPSSVIEFSAGFQQPNPPRIQAEYQTNFLQHKWNQNLSHITTGFIKNSPSQNFVQVDEAYDGGLASSLFNYANTTDDGLVDNILTAYNPQSNTPTVWQGFVNSNFPLFPEDILITYGAVFGGLVRRRFNTDMVAAWDIMYQGLIPVTVYVNHCNVMVGYDYFSPGLRTRVITEYFNIEVGSKSLMSRYHK